MTPQQSTPPSRATTASIDRDYALNNSGTLSLSGSFDAYGLTLETTDATHIDTTGQSGTSVFVAGGAIQRGDSSEANAQLGVRISF